MTLALFQLLPLLLFWQRKLDTWERLVFTGFVSENGELSWSLGVPSKVSVFRSQDGSRFQVSVFRFQIFCLFFLTPET